MYQPKTGEKCGCKPGVQRDNCARCEGTGWVVEAGCGSRERLVPQRQGEVSLRRNGGGGMNNTWKRWAVRLKHDAGVITLHVCATTRESAIVTACACEKCPRCAVVSCKGVKP
jgi:hypothetical protein